MSKDHVLGVIDQRVKEILDKNLSSILYSDKFERMVMDRFAHHMKHGFESGYPLFGRTSFEEFLKNMIAEKVSEIINDNSVVTLKITPRVKHEDP